MKETQIVTEVGVSVGPNTYPIQRINKKKELNNLPSVGVDPAAFCRFWDFCSIFS